jgi:hypothetical protein
MNANPRDDISLADAAIHFLKAPIRLRTYANLAYLLLAMPLGLIYFVFLTVGLTTGAGLTLIWVGIPLLALVFAGSWGLAALERQLAIVALGAEVPPMLPPAGSEPAPGLLQRVKAFLANPVTWKGMAFLLLKLPLGIVSFTAVVALLATAAGLLLAPVAWYVGELTWSIEPDFEIGGWLLESPAGAWFVWLIGVAFLFVSLNLLNGLAYVWRGLATFLLGSERFAPVAPMPPALPAPAAA